MRGIVDFLMPVLTKEEVTLVDTECKRINRLTSDDRALDRQSLEKIRRKLKRVYTAHAIEKWFFIAAFFTVFLGVAKISDNSWLESFGLIVIPTAIGFVWFSIKYRYGREDQENNILQVKKGLLEIEKTMLLVLKRSQS